MQQYTNRMGRLLYIVKRAGWALIYLYAVLTFTQYKDR